MKKPSKMKTLPTNLDEQLEQLKRLKPEERRKRWQAIFGSNPPAKIHSSLMIQTLARRLQEKAFGGLKPSTQRLLQKVAEYAGAGRKAPTTGKKAQPRVGTMLVREWHGTKHQVSVVKDGFIYRSKRYGSLSQIARTITGTQWSGPLFFGLKSRTEQSRGAA
jgi:Protein of unknown function (DUF2924)